MVEDNGDGTFSAQINDRRYVFGLYDADKAARTLCELMACVGEGIHLQGLGEIASADEQTVYFAMAAKALLQGAGKDAERSLRLLRRLCCDNLNCDGNPVAQKAFSTHYQGRLGEMMSVAQAALEVQFKDFFLPLLKLLGLKKKETANTSLSDTTT